MGEVSTIGLDIAKSVFQVHGVDGAGAVVIRKRISRSKVLEFFTDLPPCLVGIEACPSAHHWGRELQELGHTVKLMPPSYVKAYLKRSKNDANDAAAICEAVTRPSMRFVPIKTKEQQTALMLHRTRQLLVRQRTMLSNALRGHLAELGIVSAKGRNGTGELLGIIADGADNRVPPAVRGILDVLAQLACPPVRQRRRRGVIVRPIVAGEGVTLTRIAVNGRVGSSCQGRFDLSLRGLRDELVLLAEVHQQRSFQSANLAEVFFRVAAVIGNGGVDFVSGGRNEGHQSTQAVPLQGNLSGRLRQLNSGADRFHDVARTRIAIIGRV